jgi:hypothetical protein
MAEQFSYLLVGYWHEISSAQHHSTIRTILGIAPPAETVMVNPQESVRYLVHGSSIIVNATSARLRKVVPPTGDHVRHMCSHLSVQPHPLWVLLGPTTFQTGILDVSTFVSSGPSSLMRSLLGPETVQLCHSDELPNRVALTVFLLCGPLTSMCERIKRQREKDLSRSSLTTMGIPLSALLPRHSSL